MLDLLWFLLLGHFLGDFAFQSDQTADTKGSSKLTLTGHVLLYTLCIALFLLIGLTFNGSSAFFSAYTALILIVVFVSHWIQDFIKASKFNRNRQSFYFDQALHVLMLFVIRIYIYNG